ncbi:MAG: PAS domain S-box protein [Pseudomonadota bacterium]
MSAPLSFLSGGGEMGALMRARDWAATPLGAAALWPAALKNTLRLILGSRHPMFLYWGPELIQFYNDAYRATLDAARHPSALGQRGPECWREAWPLIGPEIEGILAGGPATWHERRLVPLVRDGALRDAWWTYGFSPVEDEEGVRGVLVICNDVTEEQLNREALHALNRRLEQEVAERRRAEAELAAAKGRSEAALAEVSRESGQRRRLYETFLSNTPDLAYVFDLEHRFTYANEVLLRMWGRSWDEAIGRNCLELGYPAWHAEMHGREIEQVKATKAPIKGTVPFNGTFGRRMYEYIFVPVIGPDGEVEAVAGTTRDVTERAQADEAIRRNEERFRCLIEASTQVVWHCGPDGAMEEDSPTWRAFTGQTYEEWKGFGWVDAVHPDDRAASLAHWRRCMADGSVYESEQRVRAANGEYRWTAGRAVPIFGQDGMIREWVGTTTDIHDRRQAELDRQRFVSLAERSEDFIGMCGLDLRPFFLNRAAVRMIGADSIGEALATPVPEFFYPEDHAFIRDEFLPRVAREGHAETEIRMRHFRSGEPVWMIYTVYVIRDADGRPEGYATVSRNITERKLAEERLRQATVDLLDANQRKTRFLATLAHELRNPLAPLRTGLDLMQLPGASAEALGRARAMMDRQLRQMVHLIDDLMDIARIDSGKIELKRQRVALPTIVTAAVEGVAPMVEAAGHALALELPDETLWLDADPTRLAQVLANLLTNACKYTPAGGRIVLAARREDREAVITVCDSGIGIPPDALESVFEMFSQVSQNIGRAQGGLGIGLALVRSLVQMHGGTIVAGSAGVKQGSTFTLRLPLASLATAPGEPPRTEGVAPRLDGGLPILVADDNVDAATMLAAVLTARGHHVTLAHDGIAALDLARARPFALLILDVGMPGLTGYEVARAVRSLPHLAGALLAAHTGWGAEHDRSEAMAAGFDAHLTKPAGLDEIDALLGRLAAKAE